MCPYSDSTTVGTHDNQDITVNGTLISDFISDLGFDLRTYSGTIIRTFQLTFELLTLYITTSDAVTAAQPEFAVIRVL